MYRTKAGSLKRNVRFVNERFFKRWSPRMAYILGFLCADGYVFTNPRGSQYLCFVSTDREIIEKIKKCLSADQRIGVTISTYRQHKDRFVLQIGSKILVKDVARFGVVQNKSCSICFPNKIPQQFRWHFIRGYFDGDGCVYLGRHWRKDRSTYSWVFRVLFTSGSKSFLDGLRKVIARSGNSRGGFIIKKQSGYELTYSTRDAFAIGKAMYRQVQSNLYLERKQKIFDKANSIFQRSQS